MVTNFSNTAVDTTLNGAITNVATSLVVVSATGYPVVPFNIQVENEVIRVGAKSGTTFSTLTRGYDGTTGVAHVDGSGVKHVVIAEDVGRTIQDWTPALTAITLGNGSVVAKYQTVGDLCWLYFLLTLGSTSTIGTNPKFSLPVNAVRPVEDLNSSFNNIGIAKLVDMNPGVVYIGYGAIESDTVCAIRTADIVSSQITVTNITATVPFTWAAADAMGVQGTYRIG